MTRRKRKSFQKGYVFTRRTSKGKVHVIRYRITAGDGKVRHVAETVDSPRKKDAENLLAERLREVNRGHKLPAEILFEDFSKTHWEGYVQQNTKPSTRAAYQSNMRKHLIPAFGQMFLGEITAVDVMAFLEQKRVGELSQKTRLNLYVLLQKMLNFASDLELIQSNPMRRVPKPKVQRKEKPTLTPEQVRGIVEASPESFRALFVVLYLTGMRIGEALGLKWHDIDFLKGKLYLRRSLWRRADQTPKTEGSVRAKRIGPALTESLMRHRELSEYVQPDCYVFTTAVGRAVDPDDIRKRVLYPAMDRAGIERAQARAYGFHLFRHSAGSELTEATGNLKKTQSFLGHSSIAITGNVYAHLQPDADIEATLKLEDAIFPNRAQMCSKSESVVN